jgi:hypothetical protein
MLAEEIEPAGLVGGAVSPGTGGRKRLGGQLSTPEQKCIGQPEQPARRPPNWGLFLQASAGLPKTRKRGKLANDPAAIW